MLCSSSCMEGQDVSKLEMKSPLIIPFMSSLKHTRLICLISKNCTLNFIR